MPRSTFPDSHSFTFELELEVSTALSLSPGDLCSLVLPALFELDIQGVLFPGVKSPGIRNRLISANMKATGYCRGDTVPPIDEVYRNLMSRTRRRKSESGQGLSERLHGVAVTLGTAVLNQQMLIAKLSGLAEKSTEPAALTDADVMIIEALLGAADAVVTAVETSVKPVL